MQQLHERCAGIDVHKDTLAVCVLHGDGPALVQTFGATSREILRLGDWLAGQQVTAVAMESTGVYWKPIWNLLEDRFELMLVNAQHIKRVPGRKTDVSDCQWIAQLLQHGLLTASLVPARPQRELRDLTRQRTQFLGDRARVVNRIHKVLEDGNIKLGSVATDILGKSGRAMLEALIEGKRSADEMAEMAKMRMRSKIPQLREALTGRFTAHHRFMVRSLLGQIDHIDGQIESFDRRIEEVMSPLELAAVMRLDEVPGFDRRTAQNVIAEIGTDMGRFPSDRNLASWAGMCPGNDESAGKRRSGRARHANRWLKAALTQAAWAASRKRESYFKAQLARISARRGRKRAIVAVAHSLLTVAYHLLRDGVAFEDLGGDYFDRVRPERQARSLVSRLQKLGYKVTLDRDAA
jgi:transposase